LEKQRYNRNNNILMSGGIRLNKYIGFFLVLILTACLPSTPDILVSTSSANDVTGTPSIMKTHTTTSTSYKLLDGTMTPEPIVIPPTAGPDEQLYIDPEGWFSVNIPAGWQTGENRGSFAGEDGFFDTGYLPEMMFMDHHLEVCQWLANVDNEEVYAISYFMTSRNGCQLITLPEIYPQSVLEVIHNPSADFPQRYLFIRADADHFDSIAATFSWLRPVSKTPTINFKEAALRPEDISFWEHTEPMPPNISLVEYELPPEAQNQSPAEEIFLQYIPPQALPTVTESKSHSLYIPKTLEDINKNLSRFGYELSPIDESGLNNLYQDGSLVLKNIYLLPDLFINTTSSGERLAFFAHTVKDRNKSFYVENNASSYLVQNDSITLWENKPGNPMFTSRVIWIDEELMILGLGDHIDLQLRDSNNKLVFSFVTYFGAQIPFRQVNTWDDHWVLGISDFIVVDGKILNEINGFEEVYRWSLVDNKPFYFYRKGPRTGFSYDGKFFPVYYHEIAHGYCCGLALNNPRLFEDSVRFFGQRDGVWYYVVVEID
jgi:hypothetical protein